MVPHLFKAAGVWRIYYDRRYRLGHDFRDACRIARRVAGTYPDRRPHR